MKRAVITQMFAITLLLGAVGWGCPTGMLYAAAAEAPKPAGNQDAVAGMLAEGWQALNHHETDQALAIWRAYVQRLPSDRELLFAGIFRQRNPALKRLRAVGEQHDGLLLQAPFRGRDGWYVLIASDPKAIDQRRRFLNEQFGIKRVVGREAAYFQALLAKKGGVQGRAGDVQKPTVSPVAQVAKAAQHTAAASGELNAGLERLTPGELVAKARKAAAAGDRDAAIAYLGRALRRQPDMKDARLLYARLWIESNQPEEAALALAPELNGRSRDWRPWFWNGTALLLMNRLDEAARSLDEALALDGNQAAVWIQRAIVEQRRDHPRAALQMLQMAEAMHPGLPETQLNMALAYERLHQPQAAMHAWQAFLRLSGGDPARQHTRKLALEHLATLASASPEQTASGQD